MTFTGAGQVFAVILGYTTMPPPGEGHHQEKENSALPNPLSPLWRERAG